MVEGRVKSGAESPGLRAIVSPLAPSRLPPRKGILVPSGQTIADRGQLGNGLLKGSRAPRDEKDRDDQKRGHAAPEVREARPANDDSARDRDEVRGRKNLRE